MSTTPDCFYRIDNDRKNFNHFMFYKRWTTSVSQYYQKFYADCLKINNQKKLLGTIYKTYVQIIYAYKNKEISLLEYNALEKILFTDIKLSNIHRAIFFLCKQYNLNVIRIKGVNKLLEAIIII